MRYVSVCSGIEAATVAWHPLGWEPLLFAEIAKFPSRVLAHRWPGVVNVGDFTQIETPAVPSLGSACDLLVGGTPCQAFSVAGLRGGLSDARGSLALEFMRLADRLRPRWILWENVPGVLSSNGGRDFGSILGALGELGYGFAYRVLDAQFIGVPQRRRRVFVVGYLGDWRRAAAVLFERTSLRRDTPSRRKERAEAARRSEAGPRIGEVIPFDETQITSKTNRSRPSPGDPSPTLARGARPPAIAFHMTQDPISGPVSPVLKARATIGVTVYGGGSERVMRERETAACLTARTGCRFDLDTESFAVHGYRVRKLTPRECERLQGFPDDYTAIPGAKDGPRYHALGNSMAVPVMRWIGRRIAFVDSLR